MAKPKVVILGAGPAGCNFAVGLGAAAEVTLISPRDFFEVPYANLRVLVEPSFGERSCFPLQELPIKSVKVATPTSVSPDSGNVFLDNGETVPFDYLVFATGSSHGDPIAKTRSGNLLEAHKGHKANHEELKGAKSILVVGGGPVGIELAGEIATDFPDKQVTLVQSADRLLADRKPGLARAALKRLNALNVKVLTGTKALQQPDGSYKLTGDGSTLRVDKAYSAIGITPNTAFLNPLSILDGKGHIKVNEHLQVVGHPTWFAVGDCNDVKETKLGYLASMQGRLAAKSVKSMIEKGAGKAKLGIWKINGGVPAMFVTVGRNGGVGHLGPVGFPSSMVKKAKCQDLFVGKTRHDLGVVK